MFKWLKDLCKSMQPVWSLGQWMHEAEEYNQMAKNNLTLCYECNKVIDMDKKGWGRPNRNPLFAPTCASCKEQTNEK